MILEIPYAKYCILAIGSNGFLKVIQLLSYRSSHRRCCITKAILKTFAIFTGKHLRWSHFFIKV